MTITEADSITSSSSAAPGQVYDVKYVHDLRIPTSDGEVTLSADGFFPETSQAVPALVTVLPYRKDALAGIGNAAKMRWFASRGYACLLVDFRGTGASDGDQRPPFDAHEADDGVAAVDWVATQPWCNGNVGMWGLSYGAILTLRTAARRPKALKAIVPCMGALDLEYDFVHPAGNRGGLASLATWGLSTLLNQLLPPMHGYETREQQRRWRHRLNDTEPWFVDLFRHEPGHPAWRSRPIDVSTISVPAFLVAGWRDLFCEATIRAYENVTSPKKLLVGPWMHTSPEISPFEPVDYCSLLLPWWDHWLNGVPNGIMDEPEVTVFEQGAASQWRQYEAWPPPGGQLEVSPRVGTEPQTPDGSQNASALTSHGGVIAEYESDPTLGPLSGLTGVPTQGYGLGLDQHDDDARSLAATSDALSEDVVMVGRPVVTIDVAAGSDVDRIVARLTDVDPQGRSTLITLGVTPCTGTAGSHRITLTPTCYRVPAGHRVRIALSDADFPRLWPAGREGNRPRHLRITGLGLSFPTPADPEGHPVTLPKPSTVDPQVAALMLRAQPKWSIARDLIGDSVEVRMGQETAFYNADRESLLELDIETTAKVARSSPESAIIHGKANAVTRMRTGETITTEIHLRLTRASAIATARIDVDGTTTFTRQWSA